MVDGGVIDQRLEECVLLFGHLLRVRGSESAMEPAIFPVSSRKASCMAFFSESLSASSVTFRIVTVQLAGEGDGLNAAGDLFELRRVM